MTRSRALLGFIVGCLICLAAVADRGAEADRSSGPIRPTAAVGVTLSPGPGGEGEAFELFLSAGASAIEAPQPWSTLEPGRRRYHLADVAAIAAGPASDPA